MRGHRLLLLFALLTILMTNCATTRVIKTETAYRPVFPPKLRLVCDYSLPMDSLSPIIRVKLKKEELAVKVQTNYYKTSYEWFNRTICLGLSGLSILAAIKWWNAYVGPDTDRIYYGRVWGILGAVIALAYGIPGNFPLGPKTWQKEQVLSHEMSYQFSSYLSNTPVQVSGPSGETKVLESDGAGNLAVDIRDFYNVLTPDSNLILKIGYGITLASEIKVPLDYVNKVKIYEDEAKALLQQGEYDKIMSQYPNSKAAVAAKEAKIAQIRKRLQKVSDEKVRVAIAKLELDEYDAAKFGMTLENLSSSLVIAVIKNGLGMPLDDAECVQEYRNLSKFQKFYAIICYKDYLGEDAVEELSSIFNISKITAERLVEISPKNLLGK
jgi:hypothetical protein